MPPALYRDGDGKASTHRGEETAWHQAPFTHRPELQNSATGWDGGWGTKVMANRPGCAEEAGTLPGEMVAPAPHQRVSQVIQVLWPRGGRGYPLCLSVPGVAAPTHRTCGLLGDWVIS